MAVVDLEVSQKGRAIEGVPQKLIVALIESLPSSLSLPQHKIRCRLICAFGKLPLVCPHRKRSCESCRHLKGVKEENRSSFFFPLHKQGNHRHWRLDESASMAVKSCSWWKLVSLGSRIGKMDSDL